jgi:hypothetical protein
MTFSWDRSQYAANYGLQIPNRFSGSFTPTQAGCETEGPCEVMVPLSIIETGTWYLRTQGVGPWGPWSSASYSVVYPVGAFDNLMGLSFVQTSSGVTFFWDRNFYALQYRLQVPNAFVNTYEAVDLGCDSGGGSVCSVEVSLPIGSGNWYAQAKNGTSLSGWTASTYEVVANEDAVPAPTLLASEQIERQIEFSWARVEHAQEYRIQVPNNFVETVSATAANCGSGESTCSVLRDVKVGSGAWYVQARGTGVWSSWATSTYDCEALIVPIAWCNVQWPREEFSSTVGTAIDFYGQVWVEGWGYSSTRRPGIDSQFCYSTSPMTTPIDLDLLTCVDAPYHASWGNNDEYMASQSFGLVGSYEYVFAFSGDGKETWTVCTVTEGPRTGLSGLVNVN